jgi:2-polyprenyl-3-methyl-5-hydroxy-6-metoxy-1,4-benzoquinol methylase
VNEDPRTQWNIRHAEAVGAGEAPRVLQDNLHLLPCGGDALDLACGRGAGALLLAKQALRVEAWDISEVAIERLLAEAQDQGISNLHAQVRDVIQQPPEPASFDLILVSFFLERALAPRLSGALRPGGLLFYQTFTRVAVSTCGPSNPAFRLDDNELLRLFPDLRVRFYREEGLLGNLDAGCRDIAMLVAQKPGEGEDEARR